MVSSLILVAESHFPRPQQKQEPDQGGRPGTPGQARPATGQCQQDVYEYYDFTWYDFGRIAIIIIMQPIARSTQEEVAKSDPTRLHRRMRAANSQYCLCA